MYRCIRLRHNKCKAVMNFVKENKPEYIINCAAFTAVDKAEEVYDLAEK